MSEQTGIDLRLKLLRGGEAAFDLSVDLALPSSGTTVIFGPSGGGKTTILRAIAARVTADEGEGAVGGAITEAAKRLYGFELQFGAFAVAQLRLLAEMIALDAEGSPALFVTDTLSDPNANFETGQGLYREISRSQREANEVKRAQPITVVIGNPPYKEKAKGKGAWIENGRFKDGKDAPLRDWQPPKDWKVGTINESGPSRHVGGILWRNPLPHAEIEKSTLVEHCVWRMWAR
jgi:energy-coupling factor transporter ATP-binding protein EcfA2